MHTHEKDVIDAYDLFADGIFRFCVYMIGDRERSLELMQETFMKTWEYQAKGNAIAAMRPFLYMVARNLCRNESRRGPRTYSMEELAEGGIEFADDSIPSPASQADIARLHEQIALLPEKMREVVIMRHIEGLPVSEIADILKEGENAVSVRIYRGIGKLKEAFNPVTP